MKKRIELAAIASLAILAGSTPARAQAVELFAGEDVGLFTELESVSVLPTEADARASFTVRSRLGIDVVRWQFGVGADVRRSTGAAPAAPANVGVFTRHAF